MYCPNCGKAINQISTYCRFCGFKIDLTDKKKNPYRIYTISSINFWKYQEKHGMPFDNILNSDKTFLKKILEDNNDIESLHKMGLYFYFEGRAQESFTTYLKLIDLDKKDEVAWNNIGSIMSALKQYEEAEIAFKHAIEIDNYYEDAWDNLREIYVVQHKPIATGRVISQMARLFDKK